MAGVTRHTVDMMKEAGVHLTPEQEAHLRAICDQPVVSAKMLEVILECPPEDVRADVASWRGINGSTVHMMALELLQLRAAAFQRAKDANLAPVVPAEIEVGQYGGTWTITVAAAGGGPLTQDDMRRTVAAWLTALSKAPIAP